MLDGIIHFLGAFHGNVVDQVRDIQMGRARNEDDAVALLGRGLSDGVTHFPGGFVSQEADRVDGFTSRPSGDENSHRRNQ